MAAASFQQWLLSSQQRVQQVLQQQLAQGQVPARLRAAMQYGVLNGGKRLRPLLAYAAAEAIVGDAECADIPAAAAEMVHAYSLIHDDLPAMDDDVLRRGQPTCHIKFDEATAILAGDALQALAFEMIVSSSRLCCGHAIRLQMLKELTQASGWQGMVAGQALDIAATGTRLLEQELSHMHSQKTGALITASVVLGALSTNVATAAQVAQLRHFASLAGLGFQIQDDILDVEASSEMTGKQQGKDARLHKPTYTSILGMATAKQRLSQVADEAEAVLQHFPASADRLRQLGRYLVQRQS